MIQKLFSLEALYPLNVSTALDNYTAASLTVAVAQLVETLRYKPEGRGFDSRWCQWNFSLT